MENFLTAAELKRCGMAAIESGLKNGPVYLCERNRRAALVLSEGEHQKLTAAGADKLPGTPVLEWLLAHPPRGERSKQEIDRYLQGERNW